MPSGWRIVRGARLASAFNGEGARLFPGRWNSRWTAMVYLSEHQSLAALETFVHRRPLLVRETFKAVPLQWDERLTEYFPTKKLPADWRNNPSGILTREIGDRWIREGRSVALAVPSALAPADINFLLNPAHPEFAKIKIGSPIDFEFDQRLLDR